MLPSDFVRRSVVLSFQEDTIGIRLRDVIAPTGEWSGKRANNLPYKSGKVPCTTSRGEGSGDQL